MDLEVREDSPFPKNSEKEKRGFETVFVVTQDRRNVVNLDIFGGIVLINNTIQARTTDRLPSGVLLGIYESVERANEVFGIILAEYFPDGKKFTRDYFYMPKD